MPQRAGFWESIPGVSDGFVFFVHGETTFTVPLAKKVIVVGPVYMQPGRVTSGRSILASFAIPWFVEGMSRVGSHTGPLPFLNVPLAHPEGLT